MTKLILDATSLICWSDELCDDILFQKLQELEYQFIVPKRVIDEVKFNELEKPEIARSVKEKAEIREASDKRHRKLSNRHIGLGKGEISVIFIAQTLEGLESYYCVLDDNTARNVCDRLGLDKKGQIGLVADLIDNDKIELQQGKNILEEMTQGGTLLPENYKELLEKNI